MVDTIETEIRSYRAGISTHKHAYIQIVVPISGRMEMEIEGCAAKVENGTFAILPPETTHVFEAHPKSRFLIIDTDEHFISSSTASMLVNIVSPQIGTLSPAANRFFAYFLNAKEFSDYEERLSRDITVSGFSLLLNDKSLQMPAKSFPRGIIDDMKNENPMSIEHLAKRHALSRSVLYRRFHSRFGLSPKQYQIDRRLNEAARLLVETEASVTDVAFRVGYESGSSFCSTFSRRFGLSPSAYRKNEKRNS